MGSWYRQPEPAGVDVLHQDILGALGVVRPCVERLDGEAVILVPHRRVVDVDVLPGHIEPVLRESRLAAQGFVVWVWG